MLDTERMKTECRERATEYLKRDRKGKGYLCINPICTSGTGAKGTGMSTKDGIHYKCFSCGAYGDIIDLIAMSNGKEDADYIDKLKLACDKLYVPQYKKDEPTPKRTDSPKRIENKTTATPKPQKDFKKFYATCQEELKASAEGKAYLEKRGISLYTALKYNIGYCENWVHPNFEGKEWKPKPTKRLIIATSDNSYLARDIRADIPDKEKQYAKIKIGNVHLFNVPALFQRDKPVFIVEGEIDALSVMQVEGEAVGLGGTGNNKAFIELVKQNKSRISQQIIILMDNDKSGKETGELIRKELEQIEGISYQVADFTEWAGIKDCNEFLQKKPQEFKDFIQRESNRTQEELKAVAEVQRQNYLKRNVKNNLPAFMEHIASAKNKKSISTGFLTLDNVLGGGLYGGLYVMGAISSLGKTTLVLQMADYIAKQGTDVLIFSLEMSTNELIAKSISRLTYLLEKKKQGVDIDDTKPLPNAKTTRGILNGSTYNNQEAELISQALNLYGNYAEHIYIQDIKFNNGKLCSIGINEIMQTAEEHIKHTGNKPVIIVDYLQILKSDNPHATDKQKTDEAVVGLKQIATKHDIPVIAISSFNRENYNTVVTMSAFKESGAIEFTSDVLIGLQFTGIEGLKGEALKTFNDEIKKNSIRKVTLKVLKNRNGQTGEVAYKFNAPFNYFEEVGERKGNYIEQILTEEQAEEISKVFN